VIDSNNLMELLNVLPNDQNLLSLRGRVRSHGAVTLFRRALASAGRSGRLLMPVSALEETERNARKKLTVYRQVLNSLQEMSIDMDRGPWQAFTVDSLSLEVFGAFVGLLEELAKQGATARSLPTFGDALVLAHGLAHGCPVASNEWIDKTDWDGVAQNWSFLAMQ
jgi:hypothetical protein